MIMSTRTHSETELVVLPKRAQKGRRRPPAARRPGLLKFGHWWWALPGILLVLAIQNHWASLVNILINFSKTM